MKSSTTPTPPWAKAKTNSTAKRTENVIDAMRFLADLPEDERMDAINEIRKALHGYSPMRQEPVDCVLWIAADRVVANDYNPNSVMPVEMQLLHRSIQADGYTMPIVTMKEDEKEEYTIIDGFHRSRVGKEYDDIRERVRGRLPVSVVGAHRTHRPDRMAATVRHNRARGKHSVGSMSDIVVELSRRMWTEEKIAKELGMDREEVLRLKQVSGLAEAFSDQEFSEAWEAEYEDD